MPADRHRDCPRERNSTDSVLVHFTGQKDSRYYEIKKAHLDRGLYDIGYHFVIESGGRVLKGRDINRVGRHHPEFDPVSVGICVAGEKDDLEFDQQIALDLLLAKLKEDYPTTQTVKFVCRI